MAEAARQKARIAVDGMGGDHAPACVVEGSLMAANEFDAEILLVGREDDLKKHLSGSRIPDTLSIVDAAEAVQMDESPSATVRKKRDSSIAAGVRLVAERKADAFISAGNTGAVVAWTTLTWRLLPGMERPGIALILPTTKGRCLLIDAGANINPKPHHLLQYGVMGSMYSKLMLHIENPSVGLLNVGEEETKGTDFIKKTYKLLEESDLNFVGNVEGRDIFTGGSDVIVCDGFVGNVVLKVAESIAHLISDILFKGLSANLMTKLGAALARSAFKTLKQKTDYSEYGGALLLGVNGVCIISHGSSSSKAIKNAIRVAVEEVELKMNEKIVKALEAYGSGE